MNPRPASSRSLPGTGDGRRLVPPPEIDRDLPGHGELVLIVEDEPEFRALVELWVQRYGWRTATAESGLEVISWFDGTPPDVVLLDLGLPGMDGWQVLDQIRRISTVPVLVITAQGAGADVVRGLVAGADDYLTKPIRFPELIARITAALRRVGTPDNHHAEDVIDYDGLRVEGMTHRVLGAAGQVHLTPTEFRLLRVLASHPDELLGHAELLREAWGPTYGEETQLLRVTVRNLRAKLAVASPGRTWIATEYGVGYRFQSGA